MSDQGPRVWDMGEAFQIDVRGTGTLFVRKEHVVSILKCRDLEEIAAEHPTKTFQISLPNVGRRTYLGWQVRTIFECEDLLANGLDVRVRQDLADGRMTRNTNDPGGYRSRRRHNRAREATARTRGEAGLPAGATLPQCYCSPSRLGDVARMLTARFDVGGGSIGKRSAKDTEEQAQRVLSRLDVAGDSNLAELAKAVDHRVARQLAARLPELEKQAARAKRLAELLLLAAPRVMRSRAIPLLRALCLHPLGRVAAEALDEDSNTGTPRFWRVVVGAIRHNDLAKLLPVLNEVADWRDLCDQHDIPLEGDHGAARALALAVLQEGSVPLLESQPAGALLAAFQLIDADTWAHVVNRFFAKIRPQDAPAVALGAVESALGRPTESKDPRWMQVSPKIREGIEQALVERTTFTI